MSVLINCNVVNMNDNFIYEINTDSPIKEASEDKLGRNTFAERVADAITNYSKKESLVIGIYGEWGYGKTSTLNLIENALIEKNKNKKNKEKDIILKFNPWNYSNQNQLIEQFFKFLQNKLSIIDLWERGIKYSKIFSKVFEILSLLPVLKVYFETISGLLKFYSKALTSYVKNSGLLEIKENINNRLSKQKVKIIIYIDDIDRLNDNEINEIFQLIKNVADFHNTIYILSFDKNVVIPALAKSQKNCPEQYLEKIIQVPFTLPKANNNLLIETLKNRLKNLPKKLDEDRFKELFYFGINDSFNSFREINRFLNIFEFKFLAFGDELDFIDLIIITYLEVFYFDIFINIKNNKTLFFGVYANDIDIEIYFKEVKTLIYKYDGKKQDSLNYLLEMIFPKFKKISNTDYLNDTYIGKIYREENYDKFFELSLQEGDFSIKEMFDIINNYEEKLFTGYIYKAYKEGYAREFLEYIQFKLNGDDFDENIYGEIVKTLLKCYQLFNFGTEFPNSLDKIGILHILSLFLNKNTKICFIEYFDNIMKIDSIELKCDITCILYNYLNQIDGLDLEPLPKDDLKLNEYKKLKEKTFDEVKTFIKSASVFADNNRFKQIFYFSNLFDEKYLREWINIQDIPNKIKILKCLLYQHIDDYKKINFYFYPREYIKKYFSWQNDFELFIKDKQFYNLEKEEQKAIIVFLLQLKEINKKFSSGISDKDINKYIKDNNLL